MAWYELDEWNALGTSGEGIKVALEKAANQMGQAVDLTLRCSHEWKRCA